MTRRSTPSPCVVCIEPLQNNDDVIFCPECGEPYHRKCWIKNWYKCVIRGCCGKKNFTWFRIEERYLKFFRIDKSELTVKCENCFFHVSPLDIYCSNCGFEVNGFENQNTFWAYPFTKWLRCIHRYLYLVVFIASAFIISLSASYLISYAQDLSNQTVLESRELSATVTPLPMIVVHPRTPTPIFTITQATTSTPSSTSTSPPPSSPTRNPTKTPPPPGEHILMLSYI